MRRFPAFLAAFALGASAASAQTVFQVIANGDQETPPAASAGTGSGDVFFNPATSTFTYSITIGGLTGPVTAAHVHTGGLGVAGGILFNLTGGPTVWSGTSPVLTAGQVTALKTSGLYFNWHTAAFPGGEIRGQIEASGTPWFVDAPECSTWWTKATAAKETPPNPSPATATGKFTLNAAGQIDYVVNFSGLTGAFTASHLHLGLPGVAGPIIFTLFQTSPGVLSGNTVALSDAQVAELRNGRYYLNIHSTTFPGGEIRGQVLPCWVPYGTGCPGAGAVTPVIFGDGFPTPGGLMTINIKDGKPGGTAVLMGNFNGGKANLGAGCTLWLGVPIPIVLALPLDATGSIALPAAIPGTTPANLWFQLQAFSADPGAPNGQYGATMGLGMLINN